jgi:hypothetical protein
MLQITVFHKNQEISILMIKKKQITVENYKVYSVPAKESGAFRKYSKIGSSKPDKAGAQT